MNKHEKLILLAAILASGIVFLDGVVVNIALPVIAGNLHTDYSGLQWIIDGYLLTLTAMILFGGSLGDIFGQKRIFKIGLVGFGAASLLCGLAPTIGALTLARLAQGLFGALLVPSSLAVINTNFAESKRPLAIGRWTAFSGAFTALGPFAGGLLLGLSWRWIFLINLPLVVACYIAMSAGLKAKSQNHRRHAALDVLGGLLAIAGLGGTTFGLIEGPAHGWTPLNLLAILGGLCALIAFIVHEHRTSEPMLPLSLFRSRNFTGANLATLAMYAALSGGMLSITLYLQTALDYTPLAAGISFLPVTIIMMLLSGRMGALTAKYGPRAFMTVGPIIAGIGFLLMLGLSPNHREYFPYVLPGAITFGLGLSITVAPLTATVMGSVSQDRSGIASAVNNAVSRLAGLLVIAVLGIIVANQTTHSLQNTRLSGAATTTIQKSIASGLSSASLESLPANEKSAVVTITRNTQHHIFYQSIVINAGLAIAAGLISLAAIRNRRTAPRPNQTQPDGTPLAN